MIIYWAIILLEGMMLRSCLHCRSWLRLDLLIPLNHARECFCHLVICNYIPLFFISIFMVFYLLSFSILIKIIEEFNFTNHYPHLIVEVIFCSDWNSLLERFLPRQIAITRAKREWELDILSRYRSLVRVKILSFLMHPQLTCSKEKFCFKSILSHNFIMKYLQLVFITSFCKFLLG